MAERGVETVRSRSWFALVLVVLTGAGCTPMDDIMVAVFGRSMRDQPSIGAYEHPRLPAQGTVPFASGNFPAARGEFGMGQSEGIAPPPPVAPIELLQAIANPDAFPHITGLANPVASDAESLARGEVLYNRACVPCHGVEGAGVGPVVAAGVPPRSVISDEARALSDGYLYSIIRVGRGAMPAYGHQLAHFDRWHVVNYLRQLQGALPTQTGGAEGDSPDA
jgi:mono/diheme cytochrome c family protein